MDGLFGSQTIEVGIGLALFFLLVSLICTAAREAFEGMMKSRAVDLERGLRELLGDADGRSVMHDLFAHPMIFGLFGGVYDPANLTTKTPLWARIMSVLSLGKWSPPDTGPMVMRFGKARNLPSYIPASQFATALIDLVARGPAAPAPLSGATPAIAPTTPLTVEGLRQAAAAFPNVAVQRAIITGLDAAGDDIDALKKHLEDWFDGTMDRVSGWYKRRTQALLFWVGLIAAAVLNLDTLTVLDRLGKDEHLRDAAVKAAEVQIEKGRPEAPKPPAADAEPANPPPAPAEKAAAGGAAGTTEATKAADPKEEIDRLRTQLADIGYPIGWRDGFLIPGPQADLCRKPGAPKRDRTGGQAALWDDAIPADDPRCVGGWSRPVPRADLAKVGEGENTVYCARPGYVAGVEMQASDSKPCAGKTSPVTSYDVHWVVKRPLLMPVGWLITALAVMLGAPFWFDVLNKFMIVRATVKPKEKSPNEPSPDPLKPAPVVAAPQPDGSQTGQPAHHLASGPGAAAPPAPPPFTPNQWKDGSDPDRGDL